MINYLFLFFILISVIYGNVRETDSFKTVLEESIPTKTLVICDIDNTLLKPAQHLGSWMWWETLLEHWEASGLSRQEAHHLGHILWQNLNPFIPVELVDPQIATMIGSLQENQIKVICLTARHPNESDYSLNQLHALGIHLEDEFSQVLPLEPAALYKNGILFATPQNKKSNVLISFLENNNLSPSHAIFIDDRLDHVEDVIGALKERDIPCLGLWFSPKTTKEPHDGNTVMNVGP